MAGILSIVAAAAVARSATEPQAGAPGAPPAATVCQGCHGAQGEGNPAPRIPRLSGQAADYLEKQLRDYASGARRNDVMQNFAKPLSGSNIVPVLFSAVGRQRRMPQSVAIPALTTLGYAGILAGPAGIGFVARHSGLVAAFLWLATLTAGVAISGRAFEPTTSGAD